MFQPTGGQPTHPQTIAANFIFKQESTAQAGRMRTES
jgi:hypothetical protein